MENLLSSLWDHYHWQASLAALLAIVIINRGLTWLVFKHPQVQRMLELNREHDQAKWQQAKYPPVVRANQKVGLYCNTVFFLVLLPFSLDFHSEPAWHVLLDAALILMVYDLFYYFAHRFWFHGAGPMRKVHAVHHQARNPSFIDASYVHPLETFVGLSLYMGTVALLAAITGPFHVATLVLSYIVYVRLNQINHVLLDLPFFPFRAMNRAAAKHHIHHENMHKGNYSTITLIYDRLFGTYE